VVSIDQRPESGSKSKNMVAVWRKGVAVLSSPKASHNPMLMVSDVAMPPQGMYPWSATALRPAQGPLISPGPVTKLVCNFCQNAEVRIMRYASQVVRKCFKGKGTEI
jgi:hypothetical protein